MWAARSMICLVFLVILVLGSSVQAQNTGGFGQTLNELKGLLAKAHAHSAESGAAGKFQELFKKILSKIKDLDLSFKGVSKKIGDLKNLLNLVHKQKELAKRLSSFVGPLKTRALEAPNDKK